MEDGDPFDEEDGHRAAVWTRVVEVGRHHGIRWVFLHVYLTVPSDRPDMPGEAMPNPEPRL